MANKAGLILVAGGLAVAGTAIAISMSKKSEQPPPESGGLRAIGSPTLFVQPGSPSKYGLYPMAVWPIITVYIGPNDGITITSRWQVSNTSNASVPVYLNLEIVRGMWPNPQRLIGTLPGSGRFTSEAPSLVQTASASVVNVPSGGMAYVTALCVFRHSMTPAPVDLDAQVRLFVVKNLATTDPTQVANGDDPFADTGNQPRAILVRAALPSSVGDPSLSAHATYAPGRRAEWR